MELADRLAAFKAVLGSIEKVRVVSSAHRDGRVHLSVLAADAPSGLNAVRRITGAISEHGLELGRLQIAYEDDPPPAATKGVVYS